MKTHHHPITRYMQKHFEEGYLPPMHGLDSEESYFCTVLGNPDLEFRLAEGADSAYFNLEMVNGVASWREKGILRSHIPKSKLGPFRKLINDLLEATQAEMYADHKPVSALIQETKTYQGRPLEMNLERGEYLFSVRFEPVESTTLDATGELTVALQGDIGALGERKNQEAWLATLDPIAWYLHHLK